LIAYAEHQFGHRIEGLAYRERGNGNCKENCAVEIKIFIRLHFDLVSLYATDRSLSMIAYDSVTFPYCEKILELLKPWSTYLDLSSASHVVGSNEDLINDVLFYSTQTERDIATIHRHRNQFDLSDNHCQRALSYARLYEGKEEVKTDLLCSVLQACYCLRRNQGNSDEALTYAEEAYDCVAVAYNPVHPEVQKAASNLIECLLYKDNFDQAETFAQMTLDSLKDPGNGLDQQSEEVAKGYHDLGRVILRQKGDLLKAEMLVRESLRIRNLLHVADYVSVGHSVDLLAGILQDQGNVGSETQELHERSLDINIKHFGSEGLNTATSYYNLGNLHYYRAKESQDSESQEEHLRLSKPKYKEAVRMYTTIYGPDHPRTIDASTHLSNVTRMLS
jgi:hypothetical protein